MANKKVLITGGTGFLGSHLVNYLLKKGYKIVVLSRAKTHNFPKAITYVQGDITDRQAVINLFKKHGPFETVYHLAARLPISKTPKKLIWKTNFEGTVNLIRGAVKAQTKSFIFTSSNAVYGKPLANPVTEKTPLNPLEAYGKSKARAEKELKKYKDKINIQIFRPGVISGLGRLGLQAILYEFISENKNIYLVGDGSNRYQFIDADDLCHAMEKASHIKGFDIYNIGADEVLPLKEIYLAVIKHGKSRSKITPLPKRLAKLFLLLLEKLRLSPIGVYQSTMLSESLYADTRKVKRKLRWKPKKTNAQMFIENYDWYIKNKKKLKRAEGNLSPNMALPKMGILRLIKFFS